MTDGLRSPPRAARRVGDHPVPVGLGDGRRLFGADRIELELTRVLDAPSVTHLRYGDGVMRGRGFETTTNSTAACR